MNMGVGGWEANLPRSTAENRRLSLYYWGKKNSVHVNYITHLLPPPPLPIRPHLSSIAHCSALKKQGQLLILTCSCELNFLSLNEGLKINAYSISQNTPTLTNIPIIFSYV